MYTNLAHRDSVILQTGDLDPAQTLESMKGQDSRWPLSLTSILRESSVLDRVKLWLGITSN